MSWPPAGGGAGVWPVGVGGLQAQAAGAPDMSMMMGQFTPEQWASMQQQNWQQWTQWQQQYAQWQSQYGDKYAALQAMQGTGGNSGIESAAPPLPPSQPSQPAPPPPDKPPPPPYENNQPLFQSAGVSVAPVPPVSNAMLQRNSGNHQTKDIVRGPTNPAPWNSNRSERNPNPNQADWNVNQKQGNWNANSKQNQNQGNWNPNQRPGDWKVNQSQGDWNTNSRQGDWSANPTPADWNKNPKQADWNANPNQGDWDTNLKQDWKANNSWSNEGAGLGRNAGYDRNQQKPFEESIVPDGDSEALKKHAEEERLFDIQFQKWEEEFDKWKQQNINHPDKKAYADYEQKFETCRAQLMERRQQMKIKRLKLMSEAAPLPKKAPAPIPPAPPAEKFDIRKPPNNYNRYEKPEDTHQYRQDSSQYEQHEHVPMENSNDSFNSNSNFLSSNEQRKGIPGLDLVDEEDSGTKLPTKDDPNVIDITDDPPSKSNEDFSALSKGINNILGDEKILNILSMVQGQKMQPGNANSADSPRNSNVPFHGNSGNNFGRNDSYNMPGLNSGPNSNAWPNQNFQNHNVQNQNRDGLINTQQRDFNNPQNQHPKHNFGQPLGPEGSPSGRMDDLMQRRGDFQHAPNINNTGGPLLRSGRSDGPPRPDGMQRGNDFPHGPNFNVGGGPHPGPGRPNFPPHPGGMQRGNDFQQGPSFNSGGPLPGPGRPEFSPRPDSLQRGDDYSQVPNFKNSVGPPPGPVRSDLLPDSRGQDFRSNSFMGRPNMEVNPNIRQNMGPPPGSGLNQDVGIQRNIPDMGVQRPDMFMTQERGRGYGPSPQHERMGPNMGRGPIQLGSNQSGGIPSLLGPKIGPPMGQGSLMGQGPPMGQRPAMGQGPSMGQGLPVGPGMQHDMNRTPMIQVPPEPVKQPNWVDEPILEPTIIVDYEHKPLRMKVRDFIEPVQTFDYSHQSNEKDLKNEPGDRWSELDTYNQRSGTKVIDYQNRSLNDALLPSDMSRRSRFDKEQMDRKDEPSDRRDRFNDRLDDRRRDDRRDERRRDDRPDERRRDERFDDRRRDDRFDDRRRDDRPDDRRRDARGRYDRVEWSRDRGRERDTRKRDRSKEQPQEPSESAKSAKTESKTNEIKNSPNSASHGIMIDDLLEPPGRDVRPEKIIIILRGIPGSGKTYLAKLIKDREVENGGSAPRILSIDDYFIQESEIEEKDPTTGKMVKKPSMKYVFDERQEENYLNSLKRAIKRTITDQFFPFIIVDAVNEQLKCYGEIWNFARQNNFQVYICTMECDVQTAFKRNIHNRTLEDIEVIAARFFPTPKHHISIDASTLLQSAAIQEVHMVDANSDDDVIMEDAMDEPEESSDQFTSKWEKMEDSQQLARLDGISKPLRPSQYSLDEYLQLDDWQPQRTAKPGKKTVRWADIEERREQEKMRAIGFVVGQTDWHRMTDPTLGSGALTQMKYIERTRRPHV